MIYTVTFNPAIDYVVHTDAMQVGMVNRSRTEEIYYGGKGINVSLMLINWTWRTKRPDLSPGLREMRLLRSSAERVSGQNF